MSKKAVKSVVAEPPAMFRNRDLGARVERQRHVVLVLSTLCGIHGGIQRFNQLLCRAFDELAPELGYTGTVLVLGETVTDYEQLGAPWQHLKFVAGGGKQRISAAAVAICARRRPELLLIGHVGMAPIGLACIPFVRGGYCFVAHGFEVWSIPQWSRRLAARHAAGALAVSRYTGDKLAEETGLDSRRIRLLPNALEPRLNAVTEDEVQERVPPELLSVARLSAKEGEKGIDHVIRVLPRILELHPGLVYRVVGKGTDKPRLVELARTLGVAHHVIFEQNLSDDDLVDRYRSCAAFVMPSGQEGFGIVFLEAMRFARPCIGGNVGGTPEVIENGRTGLLVPFGDLGALERALKRLLSDPDLRLEMGRRGRQRVRDHFVYDVFKARVKEYVTDWLKRDRHSAPFPSTGTR